MESLPSETQIMTTLGRDSSEEDTWLDRYVPDFFKDMQYFCKDTQIWAGENFSTPAKDPPALASLPTSLLSLPVSNLASPPCSESDSIGVAASEGTEAADAGSNRPVLDLKDSDYGGEYGPETRQQSLEVASPTNTGDLRLVLQRCLDEFEIILKTDSAIPAPLGGRTIEYNPASRASYCHPELGDPEPSIFRNAFRSELSRGNSTGAKNNTYAKVPERVRHRSRNWTGVEKDAFLKVKVEAQTAVKGKDWDFISEALRDRYTFARSPKSCEDLWGTLLKPFKVIRQHESMKHSSNWFSYWELDENGRSELQLPKSFSFEWYKMIESIRAGRGKRAAGDQQWTTKDPGSTSLGGAGEYSSLLRLADGLINQQRDLPETSISNTMTMSKQGLGPYLQNVVIDALQSALKPLATILQCEHEEKQEFDARMKALDKKRRALDLEEIQIKRQRVGQHQRTSRSTCRPKQQAGLPVKKASVKKIIPAFKELNIAMAQEHIDLHDGK